MISSTKNPHVAAAAKLRKRGLREQSRRFLVEGAQAAAEALDAGAIESLFHSQETGGRIAEVLEDARRSEVRTSLVSDDVMRHLTSAVTPQGLVAVAHFVDTPLLEMPLASGIVPVLCSVRDPGNAGAILRSADAAGAAGVLFSKDSVDVYNNKAVRASAGSLFHLPVAREVAVVEAAEALRSAGAKVIAADASGARSAYEMDLTGPVGLLLGNEAWGLPPEVRDLADETVRVPIHGRAESLNLAAAATVILFEAARQRAAGPPDSEGVAALLSAFAHDIRLPLTALKGFAATLVERWGAFDDAARLELVQGMVLDTERVAAMVIMVVDVARLERGRLRLSPERLDAADAARWVVDLFTRTPEYPEVVASGTADVVADPDRLRAILLVLAEGAMWWGHQGPIRITAGREGVRGTVVVHRSGGGPTPEEAKAMFTPGAPGSKVSLQLAHRLVVAQGGSLVAEPDDGMTFRLSLPA